MIFLSCLLSLGLSYVVCHDESVVNDVPYGQTISSQELFTELPFDSVDDVLYDANGFCFVMLSSNIETPLWSAKKRHRSSESATVDRVYSAWRPVVSLDIQNSLPVGEKYTKLIKAPDSILLISSTHLVEIVLDFNCTTLVSVRTLVEQMSAPLGDVLSASFAEDLQAQDDTSPSSSLWLGTTQGLFWLAPPAATSGSAGEAWSVLQISEVTESVTSLLWVQKWGRLFAGTSVALYELQLTSYSSKLHRYTQGSSDKFRRVSGGVAAGGPYTLTFQWIGGNLDFEIKDMSYDSVQDCLWAVQQEALHQRRADGTWRRQGHYQGLITRNLTSVAVTQQSFDTTQQSHFVWVGTKDKGLMRRQVGAVAASDSVQEDAWKAWLLFYGARFLPDAYVRQLVSDDNNDQSKHGERKHSTVLVVSSTGVSFITTQEWTLADKQGVMQGYQLPRHDRHGIVAEVTLAQPGDTSRWSHSCEDSDSIWTAQYAVAASMRYSLSGQQSDRLSAWRAFQGLESLAQLSGVPGLVARTFCSPEEVAGVAENGGTSGCGVEGENNWHASSVRPGWVWKGDTSSDTVNGHYFAYGVVLDLVAETQEEQARAYKCIEDITTYIVDNDFYYIDVDGEATKWGRWNPADLNENSDFYSERGLNSLEILAFLALGYSVTGKEVFLTQFQSLSMKYGYYENALNQKIDNPYEDNHSDNELGHMAYHTLFYSLHRLQAALDSGIVPYGVAAGDMAELVTRRDALQAMTAPLLPSISRWWSIVKHERSPLWLSVVAGVAGLQVSLPDKQRAVDSLQLYSADLIAWSVHNSGRWDCPQQPYYGRDNPNNLLMRSTRPPQERVMGHHNIDPFALDSSHEATDAYSGGVGGTVEYSPAEWLLPYWSLRYYGILYGS